MLYHYFGIVLGFLRRRLVLVSAHLGEPGAHAAVWAGCNAPDNASWVQAGVFLNDVNAKTPSVYIEAKGPDVPDGYTLVSWPMARYGIPVNVQLRRTRGTQLWRATVTWKEGPQTYRKRSQWVRVPRPTIDADLELLGPSRAVCKIGLRTVRGSATK